MLIYIILLTIMQEFIATLRLVTPPHSQLL